jgi:hypothetical protein
VAVVEIVVALIAAGPAYILAVMAVRKESRDRDQGAANRTCTCTCTCDRHGSESRYSPDRSRIFALAA